MRQFVILNRLTGRWRSEKEEKEEKKGIEKRECGGRKLGRRERDRNKMRKRKKSREGGEEE